MNGLQRKLKKFKAWCDSMRSPRSNGVKRRGSDSLSSYEVDDDHKYDDDESVDHEFMKRVYGMSLDRMSRKSETYEEDLSDDGKIRRRRTLNAVSKILSIRH